MSEEPTYVPALFFCIHSGLLSYYIIDPCTMHISSIVVPENIRIGSFCYATARISASKFLFHGGIINGKILAEAMILDLHTRRFE